MSNEERKRNVKDFLDDLVNKDGLRTEVTINLTDRTLLKTTAYLIGATMISAISVFIIKGLMENKN